jgi:hypothetical protein
MPAPMAPAAVGDGQSERGQVHRVAHHPGRGSFKLRVPPGMPPNPPLACCVGSASFTGSPRHGARTSTHRHRNRQVHDIRPGNARTSSQHADGCPSEKVRAGDLHALAVRCLPCTPKELEPLIL